MGTAKDIVVKVISSKDANAIVKAQHYSGKIVNNSQIHLGVFLNGRCGGAMQFGPSMQKRNLIGLVRGTLWNEFIELNRMAFAEWLPRNSESRAIGYAMRWIKKTYPQIKWVVSFADGTQCGDGTIYRASGFVLTGIKENKTILSNGKDVIAGITFCKGKHILADGKASIEKKKKEGYYYLDGYMLRYVYFIDKASAKNLVPPVIPFSEIEKMGAGMYKGKPKRAGSIDSDVPAIQQEEGGAIPTPALQKTLEANHATR